jgi:alpha-1,2-mannosyltransferase
LRLFVPPDVPVLPYLYPPPSLLIFAPLSLLTYEQARYAVLLISHLTFLVLLWAIPLQLLHAWPLRRVGAITLCIVYSLNFHPVADTLKHGQTNILDLAFLVLFWLLSRRQRSILAAFFLALAIILKTYPLIIVPLLFLIGRWREGLYAIVWLALATVVSLALFPNAIWHDWWANVLPTGAYARAPVGLFSSAAIFNQSLNGFFARLFTESKWSHPLLVNPGLSALLTYVAAGLTIVASGIAVWRSRRLVDNLDRMMLVAPPLIFLVAPFSWVHHLVFLLPSTLMLLNSRVSLRLAPKLIFTVLCFSSAFLISIDCYLHLLFLSVVTLWGLSLFAACTEDIQLTGKRSDSDETSQLIAPLAAAAN